MGIIEALKRIPPEEVKYYLSLSYEPNQKQKIAEWTKQAISYSSQILHDSEEFIVHLLGVSFSEEDCPNMIKERIAHYGFNKE